MGRLHRQRDRRRRPQALTRRAPVGLAAVLALALPAAGCGRSTSAPAPGPRPAPQISAFLRLPVASPASCPPGSNGTTAGRRSPWVGTVDVSVFLSPHVTRAVARRLRGQLVALPHVRRVYFESQHEAYEEFRRLYTCSAQVPESAVPASYRLVLDPVTRPQRDALVRAAAALPGVRSISCDPSSPCVDVARGTSG